LRALLDSERVRIDSWLTAEDEHSLGRDVLAGLTRPFKELPPKHFYDARGSDLFERITELDEYYPTRTELEILRSRADEIVELTGAGELVELGSGASLKARILLDAMQRAGTLTRYVPLDVSEAVIREAADGLVHDYEALTVHGVVGDFERHLDKLPQPLQTPRLVALLGGTIGNFKPDARRALLAKIAVLLRDGDTFLLGTDLGKDRGVLEAAYNDSDGVTAEFNRNVLHVINGRLGADFVPDDFEHVAFFDTEQEWIDIRLRATRDAVVVIPDLDLTVEFAAGEEMRTEVSAKFTPARVRDDLAAAGLELVAWLTDPDEMFALSLARLPSGAA
jgi:L-histidine Nalpha-methyltransferase